MRAPALPVVLLTLPGLLAVAGCNSTHTSLPTASPTTAPTTAAPAPSEATPTASPTPSPTLSPTLNPTPTRTTAVPVVPSESPAPLGQPTCASGAVTITDADTLVSASYRTEVFALRTTGPPCQLDGYPTVVVPGVTATKGGSCQTDAPKPVTLSTGTSLSFNLATPRSGACTTVSSITVTLPGSSRSRPVQTDLTVCGKVVGVSPVHRSGDDGGD